MNLEWLIIGGGIHGVHLAARLLGQGAVPNQSLRIVDPSIELLQRWRQCTAVTGMQHLRSPSVHHLDLEPWSLRHYGQNLKNKMQGQFAAPYARPALGLFNGHCDKVIKDFGLDELHVKAWAQDCHLAGNGIRVKLSNGSAVTTRNILFAIGISEQPHVPAWVPKGDPRVQHVFDRDFAAWSEQQERVSVVGGGISAGQVALRLVRDGHTVDLVCRHDLREHQFDSEPGWLGPKFMRGFGKIRDFEHRRALITDARHRGSVPPDVRRALAHAIEKGSIRWHQTGVDSLMSKTDHLLLKPIEGLPLKLDRVLLATGFEAKRPGGAMLDRFVESASLPCGSCGYPIVDESLMWAPGVYVSGPLAELELGPAARNIAGARRAGDRLIAMIQARQAAA